ncbi:MAG: diacylglycerol/lipid kinase family protein [Spirochaetia bacterium]
MNYPDTFSACAMIINPSRYPAAVKMLKKILSKVTVGKVVESKSKEHFMEAVEEYYRSDLKYCIVWGGDGTAHAAINAVMKSANIPRGNQKALGFLRGGTGNGIQDSYSVPRYIRNQLAAYGESMKRHYTVPVDLMKIYDGDREIFGQLWGAGFDVDVLSQRESKLQSKGIVKSGIYHYIKSALDVFIKKDFENLSPFSVRMRNGKYAFKGTRVNAEVIFEEFVRNSRPVMIEAGTRPYYGKMFKVCPDVVCNDGNIDLYLFLMNSKGLVAGNMFSIWNGRHHKINRKLSRTGKGIIERYEIKEANVVSESPFDYHIDGELFRCQGTGGKYEIKLQVIPQALNFLVPPRFYRLFHPFEVTE